MQELPRGLCCHFINHSLSVQLWFTLPSEIQKQLTVVGCISVGQREEYKALVDGFVEWAENKHLHLNVNKTREMMIDFQKKVYRTGLLITIK